MGLPTDPIRTAVVVVHGMGEQRPLDTLKGFVQTALKLRTNDDGSRDREYYYSRPAVITKSYEARRYIARWLNSRDNPSQGDTEIFEYHWSYLMTGNRFADVVPSTLRLLVRPPWRVPQPLLGAWTLIWGLAVAALIAFGVYGFRPDIGSWRVVGIPVVVFLVLAVLALRSSVTKSFVDVVRYLDTSPRSYAARRAIRGGMVDLLRALHDGRYQRVVVIAHSLGAYISYDALMSLWTEMHTQHGPVPTIRDARRLSRLGLVEKTADVLLAWIKLFPATPPPKELVEFYQRRQFDLWRELRTRGNPWRITDFITVGTPMYLADILLTRPGLLQGLKRILRGAGGPTVASRLFDDMFRHGQLVRCPPRSETLEVEALEEKAVGFGMKAAGQVGPSQTLGSQSVFAVVRWTNLWFPAALGMFGDWFGGPLQPPFGPGIRDVAVKGNRPGRYCPAFAHTKYFNYPDKDDDSDIAHHIRAALNLGLHKELAYLRLAPIPNPNTR